MKTALLLIAHGSREPEANADLHHFVEQLRRLDRYAIVEACFLELTPPDIDAGAGACVAQEAQRIIMLPFFLSAGVHVRRDLAEARRRVAEHFPQVQMCLAEPLGRHPLLIEVVAQRAQEADRQ
jgi:sirohydrochlorin ferrochelatase